MSFKSVPSSEWAKSETVAPILTPESLDFVPCAFERELTVFLSRNTDVIFDIVQVSGFISQRVDSLSFDGKS